VGWGWEERRVDPRTAVGRQAGIQGSSVAVDRVRLAWIRYQARVSRYSVRPAAAAAACSTAPSRRHGAPLMLLAPRRSAYERETHTHTHTHVYSAFVALANLRYINALNNNNNMSVCL